MYIDGCPYNFPELANNVLPAHMAKLREAIQNPWPTSQFSQPNIGPAKVAASIGRKGDFSGCYTMLDSGKPIYVGISRKVLTRLRQHVTGKTHFDASLAYLIAQKRCPTNGKRSEVMNNPTFRSAFEGAQHHLRQLHVAFVEIENPLELYLFEPYAAIEFGTHKWNTFRTH